MPVASQALRVPAPGLGRAGFSGLRRWLRAKKESQKVPLVTSFLPTAALSSQGLPDEGGGEGWGASRSHPKEPRGRRGAPCLAGGTPLIPPGAVVPQGWVLSILPPVLSHAAPPDRGAVPMHLALPLPCSQPPRVVSAPLLLAAAPRCPAPVPCGSARSRRRMWGIQQPPVIVFFSPFCCSKSAAGSRVLPPGDKATGDVLSLQPDPGDQGPCAVPGHEELPRHGTEPLLGGDFFLVLALSPRLGLFLGHSPAVSGVGTTRLGWDKAVLVPGNEEAGPDAAVSPHPSGQSHPLVPTLRPPALGLGLGAGSCTPGPGWVAGKGLSPRPPPAPRPSPVPNPASCLAPWPAPRPSGTAAPGEPAAASALSPAPGQVLGGAAGEEGAFAG